MTMMEAEVGKHYVVTRINGKGALKRRVMDMGLTKGTELFVRKVAPMGDPIQIHVRGYEMSLRRQDAELLEVDCLD